MRLFICFCSLFFLLSCKKKSEQYFNEKGKEITTELIRELKQIDDLDALIDASARLEAQFDALVELMIEARKWQIKTKSTWKLSSEDHLISRQLALELNRLLRNPLAHHFIEKIQGPSLERLDTFEKKLHPQSASGSP